jgi:coenzyme F420-reducing hydrogenase alpha subunit
MKAITPVDIWHEGSSKEVSKLEVAISYDDLKSYASFVYRLMEEIEAATPNPAPEGFVPIPMYHTIVSGNVYMGGADYENWDDSNEAAYEYVADKLNLTIVPDPAP